MISGAKISAYLCSSCAVSIGDKSAAGVVGDVGVVVVVLALVFRLPNEDKNDFVLDDPVDRILVSDTSDIALADVEDRDLPTGIEALSVCKESAAISLMSRLSMKVMKVSDTL